MKESITFKLHTLKGSFQMPKHTKMIRTQLLITPGQKAWLRSRAMKFAISESEIIRRVLDTYMVDSTKDLKEKEDS